ncbi:hypothetical protein PFZ49_16670, partial [Microbacterium lacticum]
MGLTLGKPTGDHTMHDAQHRADRLRLAGEQEAQRVRKTGSSDIRWGSWGEAAGGEEHAEPVVVPVAVAAGEAAM